MKSFFFVVCCLLVSTASGTEISNFQDNLNLSCVKTDSSTGRQCRDLETQDRRQTVGRVCLEAGATADTIETVFEVTDPAVTLESAQLWIGTAEEWNSPVSDSPVTVTAPFSGSLGAAPLERKEEEVNPNRLTIEYRRETDFHACPSCKDQELRVVATATVRWQRTSDNKEPTEPVTVYGYQPDQTSLLSYILGDKWIVQSSITIANEDVYEGFPIQMTCECNPPSNFIDKSIAGFLRRGRRL